MRRREMQTAESPLDKTAPQRIIAAAREHFLVHGFHGVTMDDLAEGLGMHATQAMAGLVSPR